MKQRLVLIIWHNLIQSTKGVFNLTGFTSFKPPRQTLVLKLVSTFKALLLEKMKLYIVILNILVLFRECKTG